MIARCDRPAGLKRTAPGMRSGRDQNFLRMPKVAHPAEHVADADAVARAGAGRIGIEQIVDVERQLGAFNRRRQPATRSRDGSRAW